jgi:HSP20 family molecular chaperone IbpA
MTMANSTTMTKQTETTNRETTRNAQYFSPRVDIFETQSELVMFADMPGVAPKDIDLRYEQGELILQGKFTPSAKAGHVILAEFEDGDYYRVFQIHESIDASRIEAECKNGVLTVHLPKAESAKPKQVTVKAK